jgi:peptidoglycan/LPS O-acetylase OafA/YrhL
LANKLQVVRLAQYPNFLSSLLDFLRFSAAIAVFLGHTNFYWFFCGNLNGIGPQNGQDYVIIFFVLSGFVISWSIDRKKDYHFKQYLFDRMVRLWSVAIPALCLGAVLDHFGRSIHPPTYGNIFSENHIGLKYLISGLFLHESWFFSIRPGSNGPFWSLSYEFFYYLIFGAIALLPTLKSKLLVGLAFCLVAGPKVLILFPCWLLGCLSYWGCKKLRPNTLVSLVLLASSVYFLISTLAPRWATWSPANFPGLGDAPLFYSAKFLDDYAIAFALGLLLLSLSRWFTLEIKPISWLSTLIRTCSKCSFSLYAIHFPLMAFLSAIWADGLLRNVSHLQATLLVFLCCCVFALLFEVPLKWYRVLIIRTLPLLSQKCGIRS